ncbi:MAG: Uma2 family endonuclease [Sarcina sp.]
MPLLDDCKKYTIEEFESMQEKTKDNLEFLDGEIFNASTTSQKHNEIVSNIVATLRNIIPKECKVFSEMIEIILKDDFEEYRLKPDAFVVCGDFKKKGESVVEVPNIIFEVVSPKYTTHDTVKKMLIYEKFKVQEYNIIFQNGDVIQYNYNKENECYDMSVCHNRDIFKSELYEGLNIPVEDIVEGKLIERMIDIDKVISMLMDKPFNLDDKVIAEQLGLDIEKVRELRSKGNTLV